MGTKLTSPITSVLLAAAVAIGLSSAVTARQQRGHTEQSAVVTAVNNDSKAVTNMGVTDFIVRENDIAREIIRVGAAPPPSHVMLLIDDSQAAERSIQFLRTAIPAFINSLAALQPAPQIALMTFGERPTMRADFQPKNDAALAAAGKLFATPGAGSYLLQALMDTSKNLTKHTAKNPVIVVFAAEAGPEFSSEHREVVASAMQKLNASLWAIVLQSPTRLDLSPEGLERQAVLNDVVRQTGGFTRTIQSDQSVESAFGTVGDLVKSRYVVTYSRPDDLIPPKTIDVTSKRADVRVLASHWTK